MNLETCKKFTLIIISLFVILLSINEVFEIYQKMPKDTSMIQEKNASVNRYSPELLYNICVKETEEMEKRREELNANEKKIILGGEIKSKVVTTGGIPTLRLILHENIDAKDGGMVAIDLPFSQKEKYMSLGIGNVVEVEGSLVVNASYYDPEKKDSVIIPMEEKKNAPDRKHFNRIVVKAEQWR